MQSQPVNRYRPWGIRLYINRCICRSPPLQQRGFARLGAREPSAQFSVLEYRDWFGLHGVQVPEPGFHAMSSGLQFIDV